MSNYHLCPKCSPDRYIGCSHTLSIRELDDKNVQIRCLYPSCEWYDNFIMSKDELATYDLDPESIAAPEKAASKPTTKANLPSNTETTTWFPYFDRDLNLVWAVRRTVDQDGKKKVMPLYHTENDKWEYGYPGGKFLYNTPLLLKYPDYTVVIVEGEKAAGVAQRNFVKANKAYIATTSPLGASNPAKGDWELIKGRPVILWPDADEQGALYMEAVSKILREINK